MPAARLRPIARRRRLQALRLNARGRSGKKAQVRAFRQISQPTWNRVHPFQIEVPGAFNTGCQAMTPITRDDVTRAVGGADDVTIAQIIGTQASVEELAEAQAWLANDEPLMNAGRPLATGRVRELVDILSELQAEDEDEAGPAVNQEGLSQE
jgi:hypothetical protein